mgnify:CR=1 FL=1
MLDDPTNQTRALALLNDPRQIAMPSAIIGERVLNHWVDAKNKRGLWRVSSLDAYLATRLGVDEARKQRLRAKLVA